MHKCNWSDRKGIDTGIQRDRTSKETWQIGCVCRKTTTKTMVPRQTWKQGLWSLLKHILGSVLSLSVTFVNLVLYQQQSSEFSKYSSTFYICWSFHFWYLSAARAVLAAVITCPVLFISNPIIQGLILFCTKRYFKANRGSDCCRIHYKRKLEPKRPNTPQ